MNLVVFTTATCPPCKIMRPWVEQAIADGKNVIMHTLGQSQEAMNLARQYRVQAVPTLIVLNDGEEVKRSVGLIGKAAFDQLVNEL
jgi:thioredoxin 1